MPSGAAVCWDRNPPLYARVSRDPTAFFFHSLVQMCEVIVPDQRISSKHCRIYCETVSGHLGGTEVSRFSSRC